jgi:hypothetical protein
MSRPLHPTTVVLGSQGVLLEPLGMGQNPYAVRRPLIPHLLSLPNSFLTRYCSQEITVSHDSGVVYSTATMYSEKLLTKGHDSTDSPDTESLLSSEEPDETLLPSLPSTQSRRNTRLKTYLHIAAVVFYSIATIALYTWSRKINGQKCGCEDGAIYCKTVNTHSWLKLQC